MRDTWARRKYDELTGMQKEGNSCFRRSSFSPAVYLLNEHDPACPENEASGLELSGKLAFLGEGAGAPVI